MKPEQRELLEQAKDSLAAAKLLQEKGFYGYAASRAYYSMFYVAEVFLLGKGLAFSKHSGVHAAFGEHFVKPGLVPSEFQAYLTRGMELRHAGDYGKSKIISLESCAQQISNAEKFIELAKRLIGPTTSDNK